MEIWSSLVVVKARAQTSFEYADVHPVAAFGAIVYDDQRLNLSWKFRPLDQELAETHPYAEQDAASMIPPCS